LGRGRICLGSLQEEALAIYPMWSIMIVETCHGAMLELIKSSRSSQRCFAAVIAFWTLHSVERGFVRFLCCVLPYLKNILRLS
jgi:hypothetical protein